MIVEDCLAAKRRPNLMRMGILLINQSLSAEFVIECLFGWEAGLDEAVPCVHLLLWVELPPEKGIELLVCRARELSTKKLELVHPTRPKIYADLLERRTQELNTVLEGEGLAE